MFAHFRVPQREPLQRNIARVAVNVWGRDFGRETRRDARIPEKWAIFPQFVSLVA